MTDQFVPDFYAAALAITLATYPAVNMMRITAREARLTATAAARRRADDDLAAASDRRHEVPRRALNDGRAKLDDRCIRLRQRGCEDAVSG
jgi:hypothetical protein